MKSTAKFLSTAMLAFSVATAYANILRVDNNVANGAPYTTIAAAVTAAASGDTIHVAGSGVNYGAATINKKVILIGPGYLLGENPQTQAGKSPAKIGGIILFTTGSDGSFIMGFQFEGNQYLHLGGGVSGIVIKRNYFRSGTYGILMNTTSASLNTIMVQQNYFNNEPWTYSFTPQNSNIYLINNFIGGYIYGLNNSYLIIKNNVIRVNTTTAFYGSPSNSTIENNIIIYTSSSTGTGLGVSNSVQNNICDEIHFGTANGNQASVDMTTVFVADPNAALPAGISTDGRYKLKAGSPAIAAGFAGEDCGMFGGTDPYVLSGVPPVPAIYELIAPTSGTQSGGLNVTIKAKTN